jgi:hypothetical protein
MADRPGFTAGEQDRNLLMKILQIRILGNKRFFQIRKG